MLEQQYECTTPISMRTIEQVRILLKDTLSLGNRALSLRADSRLLGDLPELDSMAVVSIIAALEDHFGIAFEDDDVNADAFGTLGSLAVLVDEKLRLT